MEVADLKNKELYSGCKEFDVKKLYVFGSIVSGDFMQNSDLDFLVEFESSDYSGAFNRFMGFKERLEQIFKRPVDLLQAKKFRNTIFQQEIEKTKILLYAS